MEITIVVFRRRVGILAPRRHQGDKATCEVGLAPIQCHFSGGVIAGRKVASLLSLDMLPYPPFENLRNQRLRHAKLDRMLTNGIPHPPYFPNSIFRQLCRVYHFSLDIRAVASAVKKIRGMSIPTKIFKPVIRAITILMTGFHSIRTRANKSHEN
jgi:hypothetical protein